jgi:hypothetical protein
LSALAFLVQGSVWGSISNLFVDEIESMDRAIAASEKRLAAQHEIKNFMLEMRHLEDCVIKTENSKAEATKMVRLAEKILKVIEEERLEGLFSPAYLEELRFYSSFARKTQLAPTKKE